MDNNPEQEVYQLIYDDVENYGYYGRSNHGEKALKPILDLNPASILDVGCGHNDFILMAREAGIKKATGVDFACPSADFVCDILNLPFENKEFDFITAWDVLEHLLPEQVEPCFKEMSRVSRRFAFTIAHVPAGTPPPPKFKGHNLHQCVKEPVWWQAEIEKFGTISPSNGLFWLGEWN